MCRALVTKYQALRLIQDKYAATSPPSSSSPSAINPPSPHLREQEDSFTALDEAFLIDTDKVLGCVGANEEDVAKRLERSDLIFFFHYSSPVT